jgi:hypothetical protein
MNNKDRVHENCAYAKREVADLRAEAQRLIETGRRKYADKIIAARKESSSEDLHCKSSSGYGKRD